MKPINAASKAQIATELKLIGRSMARTTKIKNP